ncbi:MAG: nickel-responsive regulator 1 [Nanohaloarchaea archaeon SW_4_43_9]|nr:MAG: nickel-responsive regulator 1 [Nanohaloarchaea archaeon SW_4_43_9]
MSVVSVSLNDKLLEDIDDFMDEQGFSGRSEVMRTAVRALLRDRKEISDLEGIVDAVVIVTHEDEDSGEIDDIQHDYQCCTEKQKKSNSYTTNCRHRARLNKRRS